LLNVSKARAQLDVNISKKSELRVMLELERFLTISKTSELRVMLELQRVLTIRKKSQLRG